MTERNFVLHPLKEICHAIKEEISDALIIVDSMSAFGAYDVDLIDCKIDFIVSDESSDSIIRNKSKANCSLPLLK